MGDHPTASADSYGFQKIVAVLGVVLMVAKMIAWQLTGSVAILTDALESIVNVVAGFLGLYALHLSMKPKDADHPFGHGRIEIVSSSVEGTMISVAGLLIIYEAVISIMHPGPISDLDIGLIIVALAAAANFAVGSLAIRKGKANRSQALVASGKHLCSDTVSSVGIIVGLGLMLGLGALGIDAPWLDGAIALLFGGVILVTGIRVVKGSLDTLMDKADLEVLDDLVECLNARRHDHWIDIHSFRVAKYGPSLHIDMHVTVPRDMTVEQQYEEITEVTEAVREKYGDYVDLTIMCEPCRDFSCPWCNCTDCGNRSEDFVKFKEWNTETLSQDKQQGESR